MQQTEFRNLLVDQSKDLIWIINPAFQLVYGNKAFLSLMKMATGVEVKLNETAFIEGFGEGYVEKWKGYYKKALKGEYFEIEEHYFHPETNEIQYTQITFEPLIGDDNKIFAIACQSKDVTNLVKLREDNQMVDASLDVFCTIDEKGIFVKVSAASTTHWGYSPKELIGKPYQNFILEEGVPKTNEIAAAIVSGKDVNTFVNRYKKKDGGIAYNLWSARWDNTTKLMYCVAKDGKEKIEQEEKLLQSEQRFKALVQEGSDLIGILDEEGKYSYVSPTSISVLGMAPEEFIGRNAFEFIHPDDAERVLTSLQKITSENKVMIEPFRFQNHKKEWRWVETVLTNMLDNPAVNGIVANSRDITDKIEEQRRLKLLESVITNTNEAVLITEAEPQDEPGPKIIYVNEAFMKMTGYTAEEIIGKTPRILQGPNSNKEELVKLSRALRNWEPYEMTTINYKKNGEEFWINFSVTPVANEKGWFTHWIAIERDVTKQKTEELKKDLVNKISDIFNQNSDTNLATCLSELCKQIVKFGDFSFAEMWLPAIDAKTINRVTNYVEGKAGNDFYSTAKNLNSFALGEGMPGYVWKNKKTAVWGASDEKWDIFKRRVAAKKTGIEAMMGIPLKHKNEVVGILLLGTEKKKPDLALHIELFQKLEETIGAELSRKKLEIELAQIFNFTPDMICVAGFDGYIKRINPAGLELLGYSLEEMRSRPIKSFIHEEDKLLTAEKQIGLYNGENLRNFENRYLTKEGKIVWLSWTATSVLEHGIVYAVAKNITEEKKLRELNRQAGELAKIGGWELDLKTMTPYFTEETFRIYELPFGSPPKVEDGMKFYAPEAQPIIQKAVAQAIENNTPYNLEVPFITAKGKNIWVRTYGNIEVVDGKAVRLYGAIQDITDLKDAQIRLQSLADNLPAVVFQYLIYPDGTDTLKYVTKGSQQVWGFTAEDVLENNQLVWERMKVAGEFEKINTSISESITSKSKWTARWKYIMPTGEVKTHIGYGTPVFLANGTVLFNSIVLDITQEAHNEELLKQTAQIARVGSWEMDLINQNGDKMYWSPMIKKILEIEESYNPTLTSGIEFHVGESKERIKKALNLLIKEGVEFDEEILMRTAKGNERWTRAIGKSEMADNKRTKIYGSYQDIHEKKLATLELEKSLKALKDYKYSLDQSAIVAFTDQKGVITYVNDNFCKISKYNRKEIIGKTHQLINSKHHPSAFFKNLWKTIALGKVWRGEIKNKAKDGSYYWMDTTIVPFLDEKNKPVQYLAIRFDITERKKAEEEKNALQTTLENSLNEIYICDIDTLKFTYVNKGALLNLGYSEQEIKTLTPLNIKPEFSVTSYKRLVDQLVNKEKERIIFFTNHKRKDGSLYPVEVHLQLLAGNSKSFLAIVLDITVRKKAEESILKANERFEKVTEATNDVIWDWDIVNDKFYRSKAIEKFFGKEASKLMKLQDFWKDSFHPEDVSKIKSSINEAFSDPSCNRWESEYRLFNEQGKTLYVIDRGIIIRNEKGKAVRMVGAMTDVTSQKEMTLKLSELNKVLQQHTSELERSNKELEQFAFVTSHDLQEPLRMVSSFMDQLKRKYGDQLDEKGLQYIHFATDGAKRMKQIILDLLDYSRAGKLAEELIKFDLNQILEDYKVLRRKIIEEKNVIILNDPLPLVNSYQVPLTQAFHCILDNAIKYSKEDVQPKIEISVSEKENNWIIAIKDNGIGIDKQFFEKIFIIFQRLHDKGKYDGTGIGLAIAKKNIEACNGKIWVESTVNKGSTFYFTINKIKL